MLKRPKALRNTYAGVPGKCLCDGSRLEPVLQPLLCSRNKGWCQQVRPWQDSSPEAVHNLEAVSLDTYKHTCEYEQLPALLFTYYASTSKAGFYSTNPFLVESGFWAVYYSIQPRMVLVCTFPRPSSLAMMIYPVITMAGSLNTMSLYHMSSLGGPFSAYLSMLGSLLKTPVRNARVEQHPSNTFLC